MTTKTYTPEEKFGAIAIKALGTEELGSTWIDDEDEDRFAIMLGAVKQWQKMKEIEHIVLKKHGPGMTEELMTIEEIRVVIFIGQPDSLIYRLRDFEELKKKFPKEN